MTDTDPHADDPRAENSAEWFTSQFDEDVDDEPADVEGFAAPRSAASALGGDYSPSSAGGPAGDSGFKWGLKPRTFDGSADASGFEPDAEQPAADQDTPVDAPVDGVSVDTVVFSVEDDLADSGDGRRDTSPDADSGLASHARFADTESADAESADAESAESGAARLGEFPPPPVITRGSGDVAAARVGASDGVDAEPVPVDVSLAGGSGSSMPVDLSNRSAAGPAAVSADERSADQGGADERSADQGGADERSADQRGAAEKRTDTAQAEAEAEAQAEAAAESGFPAGTALPTPSGRWTSPAPRELPDSAGAHVTESTGTGDVAGTAELPADLAEAAAEIPTMEEVLEAPSPRRAAREAAAKEAALREAAERTGHTGAIPLPSFIGAAGPSSDGSTGSAPSAAPDVAVVEPVPGPVIGENDFGVAEPADTDLRPAGVRPADAGVRPADVGVRPADVGVRPAASDASFAFVAGRRPDASNPGASASRPVETSDDSAARDSDLAPIDDGASAPTTRSADGGASAATTRAAGAPLFAEPDAETRASSSDSSRSARRSARPPATTRQKVLFAILAVVIVVALVLLIVMLTTQSGTAGALGDGSSIAVRAIGARSIAA